MEGIKVAFEAIRPPFPSIPPILLLCEIRLRPGMSPTQLCGDIINSFQEIGIPTGPNPDGSENLINKVECARSNVIIDHIRKNASVKCVIPPGAIISTGVGGNVGGPVEVQSSNVDYITAKGIIV